MRGWCPALPRDGSERGLRNRLVSRAVEYISGGCAAGENDRREVFPQLAETIFITH
jgi:hypothetical protein